MMMKWANCLSQSSTQTQHGCWRGNLEFWLWYRSTSSSSVDVTRFKFCDFLWQNKQFSARLRCLCFSTSLLLSVHESAIQTNQYFPFRLNDTKLFAVDQSERRESICLNKYCELMSNFLNVAWNQVAWKLAKNTLSDSHCIVNHTTLTVHSSSTILLFSFYGFSLFLMKWRSEEQFENFHTQRKKSLSS